jgi:hypothetical protein
MKSFQGIVLFFAYNRIQLVPFLICLPCEELPGKVEAWTTLNPTLSENEAEEVVAPYDWIILQYQRG